MLDVCTKGVCSRKNRHPYEFSEKKQKMAKYLKIWANCTKCEDILKKYNLMHATIAHMKQLEYALIYVVF